MDHASKVAQSIQEWAATLNNRAASTQQFKEAHEGLLNVRKSLNPSSCIAVSRILLSPLVDTSRPLAVSDDNVTPFLYGFQFIRDVILRSTTPWASFPDEIRVAVREIAVAIYQRVSEADSTGARRHVIPSTIISASAALLSSLAVREWPQRWPTFLDDLLADSARAEMACLVLRDLSVDIHEFPDWIVPARRQELTRAMALTLPQCLGFVTAAADAFLQQKNCRALDAVMETLQSFLTWASLQSVFSAGVPQACFALLRDKMTKETALKVLTEVVKRRFSDPGTRVEETKEGAAELNVDFEVAFRNVIFGGLADFVSNSSLSYVASFSPLLPSNALPALHKAHVTSQSQISYDLEEHEFHIKFFEMANALGCTNFFSTFIYSKRKGRRQLNPDELQQGAAFVDLMTMAMASPSVAIRLKVLPFFATALNYVLRHQDELGPVTEGLTQFLVVAYFQAASLSLIQFPNEYDQIRTRFEEMDSDVVLDEEAESTFGFLARTLSCVGMTAKICPEFIGERALNRFLQLLSKYPGTSVNGNSVEGEAHQPSGSIRASGFVIADGSQHGWGFGNFARSAKEVWVSCFSAMIMATDAALIGVDTSKISFRTEVMYDLMSKSFHMITAISETDLLPLKAQALRMFTPLYASPDVAFLQKAFEELVAQGSNLGGTSDSRNKACQALRTICSRLQRKPNGFQSLESFRQPMCEYTVQAFRSPKFETGNKLRLLEASISTILGSSTASEQTSFIERLLSPFLEILESEVVQRSIQDPNSLLSLASETKNDVTYVFDAFQALEAGTHQLVKPLMKLYQISAGQEVVASTIGRSLIVSLRVIQSSHELYNPSKFTAGGLGNEVQQSVLHLTSGEIAFILNLDGQPKRLEQEQMLDLSRHNNTASLDSSRDQKSNEALLKFGIEPPNPTYNLQRERFTLLRRSSYEIARCAIYSGATRDPNCLHAVISAVATDYQYMEPIHFIELVRKVLQPLLSFSLASNHVPHLEKLWNSPLPRLIERIRTHIEQIGQEQVVEGKDKLIGLTREHGRKALVRPAIDVIMNMYPRQETKGRGKGSEMAETEEYLPGVFSQANELGQELLMLWVAICCVWELDRGNGAARAAFYAVGTAADMAPKHCFASFGPLVKTCLNAAVKNSGLREDSPLESSTTALVSVMRKWPSESEKFLKELLGNEDSDAHAWVTDCVTHVVESLEGKGKTKKQRLHVRTFVAKLADLHGLSNERKNKVKALPEKLVTKNPARSNNKNRNELEEIILADAALDSLYHDGDPL